MSAPGLKITNFHMLPEFPKADYAEYPKWIHMTGFKSEIVETAEEEAILRARIADTAPTQHAELMNKITEPPDEKALWIEIADKNGIKIDKRWGLEKIKAAIEAHKPE